MDTEEARSVASRCHRVLEPLHALIYFAPEAEQRYTAVGLRPGRMGYFASRSAAMGPVSAGTVTATFYNFNPDLVARHIPRAWTLADPEHILAARTEVADAALRRLLGEAIATAELAEAATLAREAAEACTPEGRPLYAAHAELDWPSEPHLALWHAITLLREFRGDGHIATLVAHGLTGLEALITHTATGHGFVLSAAKATRAWSDQDWDTTSARLRADGVLSEDGTLTEDGTQLRQRIEDQTNATATGPWRHLGTDKANRLHDIGRELRRTALAAGAFPDGVFASSRQ